MENKFEYIETTTVYQYVSFTFISYFLNIRKLIDYFQLIIDKIPSFIDFSTEIEVKTIHLQSLKLRDMEFKELISHYHMLDASGGKVALWKINPEICEENSSPEIGDIHLILFVISGKVEISIQGKRRSLTRGYFADIIGGKSVRLVSVSSDVRACSLLITESYLSELFKSKPPFPLSYVTSLVQNPVYAVEESFITSITNCMDDIEQVILNPLYYFQEAMLKCRIWILFLQMADIIQQKTQEEKNKSEESNRKTMLFSQFLKLLSEYVKKEHTVNFYASRLNITPQYLRRIVKECSKKTVSTWIEEELLREIIRLLLNTNMTIQKITDELNFSEQAVLTKFFKRCKGVSPLKYRNGMEA